MILAGLICIVCVHTLILRGWGPNYHTEIWIAFGFAAAAVVGVLDDFHGPFSLTHIYPTSFLGKSVPITHLVHVPVRLPRNLWQVQSSIRLQQKSNNLAAAKKRKKERRRREERERRGESAKFLLLLSKIITFLKGLFQKLDPRPSVLAKGRPFLQAALFKEVHFFGLGYVFCQSKMNNNILVGNEFRNDFTICSWLDDQRSWGSATLWESC